MINITDAHTHTKRAYPVKKNESKKIEKRKE